MSALELFERDVVECGVPLGEVRALVKRYDRALRSGGCADWVELYVGLFVTLLRCAHRTRTADLAAARRLLLLLEDDLGAQLFDAEALAQLEQSLFVRAA